VKKVIFSTVLVVVLFTGIVQAQTIYDFGGETVWIWHNQTYERMYGDNPEGVAHLDWVEKTFNVDLEWSTPGAPQDARMVEPLAAAVMAGDAPDLFRIQTRGMALAALQGLVRPINDVVDEEFKTRIPSWKINDFDSISKVGDSYYAFGADPPQGTGIWWNKAIFEREGLVSPYELYINGEWTWDAMRDLAIKATRDTDGDGEIDQWGLAEYESWTIGLPVWLLASNEATTFRIDENGHAVFAMDEPEAMAVWEFLYDLAHVSKVMPVEGVDRRAVFQAGDAAMIAHRTWGARHFSSMEEDYSFVPFPKGPKADRHYAVFNHANVWGIPVTSKWPTEALVELLYAIFKMPEEYMDADSETEKEDWATSFFIMNARDYESVETFYWVIDNSEVFTAHDEVYIPGFADAMTRIVVYGENPATVIASMKQPVQAHLDELFNK